MATVRLDGVTKSFGEVEVIRGVDLDIADGEFAVFVGPSGCGKSTLLRLVSGLEETTGGAIRIGGRDVTRVEPADRGVAMVFQSYALYPHMSVYDNMAFGLKMTGHDRRLIDERVRAAAAILELTPLLDRKPAAMSGGQRQRVAIGRAIVREPDVFLFDEPLSNLDAELRVAMRLEIAKLHDSLTSTMIYVTHDQTEAMTLADKIVVLRAGIVEQVGSPIGLYDDPDNAFVAGFIGSTAHELPARPRGASGERAGRDGRRAGARRRAARVAPRGAARPRHAGLARHPPGAFHGWPGRKRGRRRGRGRGRRRGRDVRGARLGGRAAGRRLLPLSGRRSGRAADGRAARPFAPAPWRARDARRRAGAGDDVHGRGSADLKVAPAPPVAGLDSGCLRARTSAPRRRMIAIA